MFFVVLQKFDSNDELVAKVERLTELVRNARHIVVHTGAGCSTAAGIPDFRGPNGVWTLERAGKTPQVNITFEQAQPTFTHRALVKLWQAGLVKCVHFELKTQCQHTINVQMRNYAEH